MHHDKLLSLWCSVINLKLNHKNQIHELQEFIRIHSLCFLWLIKRAKTGFRPYNKKQTF